MGRSKATALTLKQRRFVEAYMGEAMGNAGKAYRLAGYACASAQIAYTDGHRMLRLPKIREAIEQHPACPGRVRSDLSGGAAPVSVAMRAARKSMSPSERFTHEEVARLARLEAEADAVRANTKKNAVFGLIEAVGGSSIIEPTQHRCPTCGRAA